MSEVYPDAKIQLLVCQHYDLAGNQCTVAPIGSVSFAVAERGWPGLMSGPFCEEHLRVAFDSITKGPKKVEWCSSLTSDGRPCNAPPGHELDGRPLCGAHYRKAVAQKEGRE